MTSAPMSADRPTEKIMLGLLVEKGDRTITLVAILGFGLGGAMSLTAVVAFGVLLGMRAHAER